jgi:hypothetical protein
MPPITYELARQIKQKFESELMNMPNVVGVGVGLRQVEGEYTDEIALIVMVKKKFDEAELSPEEVVPQELEGLRVDVQEVGDVRAGG